MASLAHMMPPEAMMNTIELYVLPTLEKKRICSSRVLLLTIEICHASTKIDATSAISVAKTR